MWLKKTFLIFITISILLTFVKASCLEYGHSCWGAHGKRSMNTLHATSKPINDEENDTSDKRGMDSSNVFITPYPTRLFKYRDIDDIDDDVSDNDDLKQYSSSNNRNELPSRYWRPNIFEYDKKVKMSPLNRRLEYLDKSMMKHKKFTRRQLHKPLLQRLELNDDDNDIL